MKARPVARHHVRFGFKLRRTQCEQMSSQLPLKADVAQHSRHFAFVTNADIRRRLGGD